MFADKIFAESMTKNNNIDNMCTFDDGDMIDAIADMDNDDDSINDIYGDTQVDYIDGNDIDIYS